MTFKNYDDILAFRDRFDGYVFVDAKGNEYPGCVEFAPWQYCPSKKPAKKDAKVNTLETEPHYLAFVEKLKADAEAKPSEGKLEYTYKIKEHQEITTTPLLEFLAKKRLEKNEEKKKKSEDRKKRRDEERQKKKVQVAKNIPEAIKEEKADSKPTVEAVDENGIMVRVVPSRLDRNQRQKIAKEEKREAKKERDKDRIRERKEKRQERREKERDKKNQEKADKSGGQEKKVEEKPVEAASKPAEAAPKSEEKPAETTAVAAKPNMPPPQKKREGREVKKYSERRKEIRERAEQRRNAAEAEEVEKKPEPEPVKPEQPPQESWTYKESTDSEDKARRIRNKDRPALQIYQPRRQRLAANFDGADGDKKGKRGSKKREPKEKSSSETTEVVEKAINLS